MASDGGFGAEEYEQGFYVIGMSQAILDDAAYFFAVGFYRGLGYGKSVEAAYELGCNAIELQINSKGAGTARKLTPVDGTEATALPQHWKPALYRHSRLDATSSAEPQPPSPEFVEAVDFG